MTGSARGCLLFGLHTMLWCTLIQVVRSDSPSLHDCSDYVTEGKDLHCHCSLPSSPNSKVSWPGHSKNSTLTVTNVKRTMNGTQYVCQQTSDGGTAPGTVTYTLKVAFGPDVESVTVSQQPSPFVVDGVSRVTLTCHATVYPKADYTWKYTTGDLTRTCEGDSASNNWCTYIPQFNEPEGSIQCTCLNHVAGKFSNKIFHPAFQYEPQIVNYSVNYSPSALTADSTPESATLRCVAKGRPAPTITFYDSTHKEMSDVTVTENTTSTTESARSVIFAVTDCQQTGKYTCEASNTLPSRRTTRTVLVNVTCPPTSADLTFKNNIPAIRGSDHLSFTLKANPPPHTFQFRYVGNGTANGQEADVSSGPPYFNFTSVCRPDSDFPYLATCSVAAVNVPAEYMGVFNGTAISSKGTFEFQFQVEPKAAADAITAMIVGGVVGAVVGVVVVVVSVVYIIRRRMTNGRKNDGQPQKSPDHHHEEIGMPTKKTCSKSSLGPSSRQPVTKNGPDLATGGTRFQPDFSANANLYAVSNVSKLNSAHHDGEDSTRRLIPGGENSESSSTPSAKSKSDQAGYGMRREGAKEKLLPESTRRQPRDDEYNTISLDPAKTVTPQTDENTYDHLHQVFK